MLLAACAVTGCRSSRTPEAGQRLIGWRPIEHWTGHESTQTESFNIESTQWRIKWETKGQPPSGAGHGNAADAAMFRVVVHSAVSGRPIAVAVEHEGVGKGTA